MSGEPLAITEAPPGDSAILFGEVKTPVLGQRRLWLELTRRRSVLAGIVLISIWVLLGVLAPLLPISDPNAVRIENNLNSPSLSHLFGTDELGRDVLSRVIYAARISVPTGLVVVFLSAIIGCLAGAVAGNATGLTDQVIMRTCDALLSFPSIMLAMAIAALRGGPGLGNVIFAVVLVLWPEYARLMRGQVLQLRERDYVTAAAAVGATRARIFWRHIIPNAIAPILIKGTLDVGGAILLTASLSFLGFGAIPPTAEWGSMVSQGAKSGLEFWWVSAFPALAIVSVVMALNFLGDGLRDAFDPRGWSGEYKPVNKL